MARRYGVRVALGVLRSGEPHEPDFAVLAGLGERGVLLDLGAHAGQSAASCLAVRPGWRVLSIEADPAMRWPLAAVAVALRGRMRFRMVGVGAQAGERVLCVPTCRGERIEGEATFDEAGLHEDPETAARLRRLGWDGTQRVRVPVTTVDALGVRPTAIKLDLQGGELAALQGARDTLRACRPLVLMENNRRSPEVAALLEGLGYRREGRFEDLNVVFRASATS